MKIARHVLGSLMVLGLVIGAVITSLENLNPRYREYFAIAYSFVIVCGFVVMFMQGHEDKGRGLVTSPGGGKYEAMGWLILLIPAFLGAFLLLIIFFFGP